MTDAHQLKCFAWLPQQIELPQAVRHDADGDKVIISVVNNLGQTVQVVFENKSDTGEMMVRLRGWGNIPDKIGNWDKTNFSAIIPLESIA